MRLVFGCHKMRPPPILTQQKLKSIYKDLKLGSLMYTTQMVSAPHCFLKTTSLKWLLVQQWQAEHTFKDQGWGWGVFDCLGPDQESTRGHVLSETYSSIIFSSVTQSCPTLCDPLNHSMPVLPVHHQLPEFTQTHVHRVGDAIQPSHPLSSPSPPDPNPSQHQGLFQWVNSSHQVAKVLEFQLQHQSFQWTRRTDLL